MTKKRNNECCLHPCSIDQCPLEMCAAEFPGGVPAYLRYVETQEVLKTGADTTLVAEKLGISISAAERRFNKVAGK